MDLSYATIPIFGQLRRLYREAQMKFLVSSPEKPENPPLYSVHTDLDSFILYNDQSPEEPRSNNGNTNIQPMDFNIIATLEEYKEEDHGKTAENIPLNET